MIVLIIGVILLLAGLGLTWLAMNTPLQLQPLTWVFMLVGALMTAAGLGSII